jgi:hypothetical protein
MPTSGTTFTDWEQVETDRRRPLLVDEDFSWSEPPVRRRRATASEERPARRRRAAVQRDSESRYAAESEQASQPDRASQSEQAARADHRSEPPRQDSSYATGSAFGLNPIDVERELDIGWGGRLSASAADTYEVVPDSFTGDASAEPGGRRTVVITGRGAGHYSTSRRHAEAGLAFHERSGFNPDRMAMWAVLLGIALMLGCIAH